MRKSRVVMSYSVSQKPAIEFSQLTFTMIGLADLLYVLVVAIIAYSRRGRYQESSAAF